MRRDRDRMTTGEHRLAEVVKRSTARTDGLLDRALAIIASTLEPFGHVEDQLEEPAPDGSRDVRPGDSV